jgi:hypothetical protein
MQESTKHAPHHEPALKHKLTQAKSSHCLIQDEQCGRATLHGGVNKSDAMTWKNIKGTHTKQKNIGGMFWKTNEKQADRNRGPAAFYGKRV